MAWTTLSLIGLILIGGAGALLWQRHRARWLALTRYTVRCPLYDSLATVVVGTNLLAQPWRQHIDVVACSLHPETLDTFPERLVFVLDTSYAQRYPQAPGQYPRSSLKVPCRKNCLAILNKAAGSRSTRSVRYTQERR
jgi:hypothetical protein